MSSSTPASSGDRQPGQRLPGARRGRRPSHRCDRTCRGRGRRGARRPSAWSQPERHARREPTRNRSKAPETCRQSSSAHTRSCSKPRAHPSAAANPRSPTAMVLSPSSSPEVAPTAAIVCELLCMSAPSTIMAFVPSSRPEADARRTWLAGGGATLLSSHAGPSPTSDERHSESQSGPTADSVKASQLAASRSLSSRPDVTAPIQTASVKAGVRSRFGHERSTRRLNQLVERPPSVVDL